MADLDGAARIAWLGVRKLTFAVFAAAVFGVSALLLTSLGGLSIYVSPVTLPLILIVVAMHPSLMMRLAGVAVGGLTAFLAGWALGDFAAPGAGGIAGLVVAVAYAWLIWMTRALEGDSVQ